MTDTPEKWIEEAAKEWMGQYREYPNHAAFVDALSAVIAKWFARHSPRSAAACKDCEANDRDFRAIADELALTEHTREAIVKRIREILAEAALASAPPDAKETWKCPNCSYYFEGWSFASTHTCPNDGALLVKATAAPQEEKP